MKRVIQSVKGTRDFYPEAMALRTWLYTKFREASEAFGYQEWEAPLIELLELYAAKSGDELVREQAYVFTDRGGSQLTLRPELTPSLARMVAQRQNELTFPLRWWSFGPCWRYERPQKGRTREFFQWNVDLLGADSPEADAENVAVLAHFFRLVGLLPTQVKIMVNSRQLLDRRLAEFEVAMPRRAAVAEWIDRRGKLSAQQWEKLGADAGLIGRQIKQVIAMLEEQEAWRKSEELVRFFAAMDALGLGAYVSFSPGVVRGLAYYTGTVFEAWEIGGEIKRAILGGGRYDNLLSAVGGEPLPAVGFAMGDVVIGLVLGKAGLLPSDQSASPARVLITAFDSERVAPSFAVAAELRSAGIACLTYPDPARLQKQFRYADRLGVRLVLVLGPDEIARGTVVVKDLASGAQESVQRGILAHFIRSRLQQEPASKRLGEE